MELVIGLPPLLEPIWLFPGSLGDDHEIIPDSSGPTPGFMLRRAAPIACEPLLDCCAILYRQILQKCCTCRNNPHPGTRICLRSVTGPKGHLVYLQDCSCIQMGYCHNSQFRFLSHSSLTFHLSSCATFQIVFPHCGMNLDGRRRCLEIGRQASVPYRFW